MTPEDPAELERLRTEVQQLRAQVQSLHSALALNTDVTAELLLLLGEPDSEHRSRALLKVGDATKEIHRLLSGPAFDGQAPVKAEGQ